MDILFNYTFQIVAFGSLVLAVTAGSVGAFSVYKGQSLIGDAIGHSTFPGIILAYMVFATRSPVVLLCGAIAAGAASYALIQLAHEDKRLGLDANLAIFLSGFFGLGMALKSFIQGNPDYAGASQAGLGTYIFGQAAYMLEIDVMLICGVSVLCLVILLAFYKELKLFVFDAEYARVAGLPCRLLNVLLLVMTISVIGIGIKAVGAILISSFLIIPCVAANQWSNEFSRVLLICSAIRPVSAVLGTYISTAEQGMSTGPCIILVACLIAFFSMLFGTKGILARTLKRRDRHG
ncbi:metal ABC transporter permease [uncultured Selenomonas sp.]|uniref:metal ABC transporter permease n=1 Tax=uncultured Selenomonas sp. TaxID=159275 RepID=UPI002803A5D2|nr:metal ABC transporter permease [uncultured Selenomonas sp.]